MRAFLLLILFVSFEQNVFGQNVQVFSNSTSLAVAANTTGTQTINVSSTGFSTTSSTWGIYSVKVNITCTKKNYLTLRLTSPDGRTRILHTSNTLSGASYRNFVSTVFRDDACNTFTTFYGATTTYRHHTPAVGNLRKH